MILIIIPMLLYLGQLKKSAKFISKGGGTLSGPGGHFFLDRGTSTEHF